MSRSLNSHHAKTLWIIRELANRKDMDIGTRVGFSQCFAKHDSQEHDMITNPRRFGGR